MLGVVIMPTVPLSWYLILAFALFTVGAIGLLTRRNGLTVLMSIEIMLGAINLTFLAFARFRDDEVGHIVTLFVIGVAAAEAAVGLALVLGLSRHTGSVQVDGLRTMQR